MQGALSGDPSARTNTDRGGCITSLSFLPSTVGFFLSQPGAKPERLSFLVSSTMQRIAAYSCLHVGKCLDERWGKYGDVSGHFHEKKTLGARGELPQLESGRPNFLLFLPTVRGFRSPICWIGCREAKFWIEDSTIEGRKERFVESPSSFPRSPFSPLFQINHTTRRCFGIRFSNFNSTRPRTRSDPFHAILADNSTVRSRDDHSRFPAPRWPLSIPVFNEQKRTVVETRRCGFSCSMLRGQLTAETFVTRVPCSIHLMR